MVWIVCSRMRRPSGHFCYRKNEQFRSLARRWIALQVSIRIKSSPLQPNVAPTLSTVCCRVLRIEEVQYNVPRRLQNPVLSIRLSSEKICVHCANRLQQSPEFLCTECRKRTFAADNSNMTQNPYRSGLCSILLGSMVVTSGSFCFIL